MVVREHHGGCSARNDRRVDVTRGHLQVHHLAACDRAEVAEEGEAGIERKHAEDLHWPGAQLGEVWEEVAGLAE